MIYIAIVVFVLWLAVLALRAATKINIARKRRARERITRTE